MQRNRRGWRWASGILGVVCLALVAATVLLPPEDEPPALSRTDVHEPATAPEPETDGLATGAANVAPHREASADARTSLGAGSIRAPRLSEAASRRVATTPNSQGSASAALHLGRQEVAAGLDEESNRIVPKSHTDSMWESVKPLGYVETANGQKKAIIEQGESIQLVAEGQTLADNSRVMRVTPTSIEITRGNDTRVALLQAEPAGAEEAHAQAEARAPSPPGLGPESGDLPDVADAASGAEVEDSPRQPPSPHNGGVRSEARLPHEGEIQASLGSNWRISPARPEPRLAGLEKPPTGRPAVDTEVRLPAFPSVAGSSGLLGIVQKADGTTLAVLADGDSVRLEERPQIATVTPPFLPAAFPGGMARETPRGQFRLTSPFGSRAGLGMGLGPTAALRSLGYVERADGRLQAILDEGDSVQLVVEGQVLPDGSRVVGITPTSVEVALEPSDHLRGLSAREEDLLAVATAASGMSLRWRGPRTEARLGHHESEPKAPGTPRTGVGAIFTRPPPHYVARDWIEERTRRESTGEAGKTSTTVRSPPSSAEGDPFPTVCGSGDGEVCAGNSGGEDAGGCCARSQRFSIPSLGFVGWSSGRVQAIVSQGDSVELLEEGQTLTDGSQVVAVSRHAVELSRGVLASRHSGGPGPKWAGDVGALLAVADGARGDESSMGGDLPSAGPSAPEVSPAFGLRGVRSPSMGTQRVEGTGLHLNWPVRDNGAEPGK